MAEFLVELYVARSDEGTVAECGVQARAAAEAVFRAGSRARCVSSIFVPEDETCFLLYEADTLEDVRDAAKRAGLVVERVALAHATTQPKIDGFRGSAGDCRNVASDATEFTVSEGGEG